MKRRLLNKDSTTLLEIAQALCSPSDLSAVLDLLVGKTVEYLGVKACAIWLWDENRAKLKLAAHQGLSKEFLKRMRAKVEGGLLDEEVSRGKVVVIGERSGDEKREYLEEVKEEGIRSLLSLPLAVRDKAIGIMRVYSTSSRPLTKSKVQFLSDLASWGAIAIEKAKWWKSLRERCDSLSTLLKIAKVISSSLKLEDVLNSIVRSVTATLGIKACSIRLLDEKAERLELAAAYGLSRAYLNKGPVEVRKSIIDRGALEGRPVVISDVTRDSKWQYPEEAKREGICSVLCTPLAAKGKVIGTIRAYTSQPHEFNRDEIRFLSGLASQAAIAIENAKLHRLLENQLEETLDKLIHSERLAALGKLAADVAHEINNPLTGISIYANLLLERMSQADSGYERLKRIGEEIERCKKIVRGLLEFARQRELAKGLVNINDLVERTLSLVEGQALFHNIRVEKQLESIPKIMADPSQIEQVFINIIINATEAMQDGGTLTVKTQVSDKNEFVEVKFADTGCGIPEENLPKIFEPFFTTKEAGKGTGLGLAVSRGIVERHQGSISVESKVGRGTTFIIRLPITKE